MSIKHEENDVYIIPPNFIETGTIFGGTIKLRNAAEAVILSLLIGVPVFHLPVTLTTKIIIACLTVLPAALFLPSSELAAKAFHPLSSISSFT